MSERCGYRKDSCSDTGATIKGIWTCSKHQYADELQALRDERDRLVLRLDAALDHAQQYSEGCLYCGEGEIIDGETTPEHQAECWWYRAKAALTPAGGGQDEHK